VKVKDIVGVLVAVIAVTALGGEQPPKPQELKVLERFVGTWDCAVVTKVAIWTPKEVRENMVEVNELVLDGWFLKGSSRTRDGKLRAMLMNSYDPVKKQYHVWKFTPGGSCEELTGAWDEATTTLTITNDLGDGITAKAVSHVIDKDHREYDVTAKDGDGRTYMDIHGTVTRRK
jgi:hypothetical protein